MGFLHRNFIDGSKPETEVENIIRNLGHILSTKRGSGSFLRDFGISETGYRTLEEMVTGLGAEIRETIEKYEPRLEVTEIEETYDSANRPMLAVHCAIKETGVALKISYDPRGRSAEISKKPPKKGR